MKTLSILVLLSLFIQGCSDPEPEPQKILPTESDIVGFWKLKTVLLNDVEAPFEARESNLKSEYFGIYADKVVHYVKQNPFARASDLQWELNEDLLTIGGANGEVFKIQSYGTAALIISPNARQDLKLEFERISESDFPRMGFSATVGGEMFANTFSAVDVCETSTAIYASTDAFSLIVGIPTTATTGQQLVVNETIRGFSALILTNDKTDYGSIISGNLTVVKRTSTYIHIEFEFVVQDNNGTNVITVKGGTIRAIINQ